MTSYIHNVKFVHDVEVDLEYAEIQYEKYNPKTKEYEKYTDYLNTTPLFTSNNSVSFVNKTVEYRKFLDSMVVQTLEVKQRLAQLSLDSILSWEQESRVYTRLAQSTKIIAPSFQPPVIDMRFAWQVDFIKYFCMNCMQEIIENCTNYSRLDYFTSVLRCIELGM